MNKRTNKPFEEKKEKKIAQKESLNQRVIAHILT